MDDLVHKYIKGDTAVKIASSIETSIRDRYLRPGSRLPTVRGLADHLGVSPATVAAAYRSLQSRGIVHAQGRRGTRVSFRPLHTARRPQLVARDARDLSDGNPDPELLPPQEPVLKRIDGSPRLYGLPPHDDDLVRIMRKRMNDAGVATGELTVVSGAMDGVERVLTEHLRPGDRIGVEDPGFTGVHDLALAHGLSLVPVGVDAHGPRPDALDAALRDGIQALIVTPRVQSPGGGAISESRAATLRKLLRREPDVLLIEDDHASLITDLPLHCLHDERRARWVYICSLSKSLNPDLRLAIMTGDDTTIQRVIDRQIIGERWVSHLTQRIAATQLADASVRKHLARVARTYNERRQTLVDALAAVGLVSESRSGYNVWLPVDEETSTVQALGRAGWAVAAGERFRLSSPPAIRITASTLTADEAEQLAEDVAAALSASSRSRSA